jgi:hypothetical protein
MDKVQKKYIYRFFSNSAENARFIDFLQILVLQSNRIQKYLHNSVPDWIHLAQCKDRWLALVSTGMNIRDP